MHISLVWKTCGVFTVPIFPFCRHLSLQIVFAVANEDGSSFHVHTIGNNLNTLHENDSIKDHLHKQNIFSAKNL